MYHQRETNPHFNSPPLSPPQPQRPRRASRQEPQLQLTPPGLSLPPAYNEPWSHVGSPPPEPRSRPRSPPRIQPKRRPNDQAREPRIQSKRRPNDEVLGLPVHAGLEQYPREDTQPLQPHLPPESHPYLNPEEHPYGQHGEAHPYGRYGKPKQQGNQLPRTQASEPWPIQSHEGRHTPGQQGRHPPGQHGTPQGRASDLRVPTSRKTKPIAWLIAACCTLFWLIIIVGGLTVLIVYLVFRPHLPKFDISNVSFNAAYLDMNYLLNADLTLLANFTNPNMKLNVDFNYAVMNLYHEQKFIATRYVEPFTAFRRESTLETVRMITSQVPLSTEQSQDLRRQIESGRVMFDIKGYFHARSNLGFLSYSYWLYSHCTITVTGPPAGIMIGKKCTTKR